MEESIETQPKEIVEEQLLVEGAKEKAETLLETIEFF